MVGQYERVKRLSEQVNTGCQGRVEYLTSIPVLLSPRLRIRGFRPDDINDYLIMVSDPDVVKYVAEGLPLNYESAWQSLAYLMGHWQMSGMGIWALEDRSSGQVIGRAGIYHAPGWFGPELGWMLRKEFQGQGLAYEAAEQIMDWYQKQGEVSPLVSIIHPENKPALKLSSRLGGRFDEAVRFQEQTVLRFIYDDSGMKK